jgi:hypothetical protein
MPKKDTFGTYHEKNKLIIIIIIKVLRIPFSGMLRRVALASYCQRFFQIADSFHPRHGEDTFLGNFGLQEPHGAASQKTAFFTVTNVKTSNLE